MMESAAQTTAGVMQSITCGKCGAISATARRFCGTCGARLWEPCLKCAALNSLAERFCSQCGGDLQAALDAAVLLLEERLARSVALEQEGKLLEAGDCLAGLPASAHSQLAARIEMANERREMLASMRQQAIARRAAIVEEARQLRASSRHVAALAVLQQMPASLRDQEIRTLLAEVEDTVRQIKQLRSRLQKTLKNGQLDELLESAERLQRLEPSAEDVRRLCVELRQRC